MDERLRDQFGLPDESEERGGLTRKTFLIGLAILVLFAALIIVAAVMLVRRSGGEEVAAIVKNSIMAERVTPGTDGRRIVSDKVLVVFRPEAMTPERREEIANSAGVRIVGPLGDSDPNAYVVSFPSGNSRQIRIIIERLTQFADVAEAKEILVEEEQ